MTSSSATMAINAYNIFFCSVLLFSWHASKPFVNGARAVEKHSPPSSCSGNTNGRGLVIVHRHGKCSPSSQKKSSATATPNSQMFLQDESRVHFINNGTYKPPAAAGMGKGATLPLGAGLYLVPAGFGMPEKHYDLILDTGSYVTWVNCSRGQEGITFTASPEAPCRTSCDHKQQYLDNSYVRGHFVINRLAIDHHKFPNFVFLCAISTKGFDGDDGLLGLGPYGTQAPFGNYSFISQAATKAFCHCLPTTKNTGYLYFDQDALELCHNSGNYTPLYNYLSNPSEPLYYYVNLIAITVGNTRLEIPSALSSTSSSRTIIDSGTVITRLPSSVYGTLRDVFKNLMSKYPSASLPVDQNQILDTCYNLAVHHDFQVPNVVLHFENLDVNLDKGAVTWTKAEDSPVCLAFAKSDGHTIIGSHQLQKKNVLYNIQDRRVEIAPGKC